MSSDSDNTYSDGGPSSDEEHELGPVNRRWPFGAKGKSEDVPVPSGPKCQQMSKLLAGAEENAGEYSFDGQAEMLPSVPGLFVDDVGHLPTPLNEDLAKKLIEKCEKSPFGHKMTTKMDENVRKSWQLQLSKCNSRIRSGKLE